MENNLKVISTGKRFRECVLITPIEKGKNHSETIHQEKIGGSWFNKPNFDYITLRRKLKEDELKLIKKVARL